MQVAETESKRSQKIPKPTREVVYLRLLPSTRDMIAAVQGEKGIHSQASTIEQMILSHPWCRKYREAETITLAAGDRVLVKGQPDASLNGVRVVDQAFTDIATVDTGAEL